MGYVNGPWKDVLRTCVESASQLSLGAVCSPAAAYGANVRSPSGPELRADCAAETPSTAIAAMVALVCVVLALAVVTIDEADGSVQLPDFDDVGVLLQNVDVHASNAVAALSEIAAHRQMLVRESDAEFQDLVNAFEIERNLNAGEAIGEMLLFGIGTDCDPALAAAVFRRVSQTAFQISIWGALASFYLAIMHTNGLGVERNTQFALQNLQDAIEEFVKVQTSWHNQYVN